MTHPGAQSRFYQYSKQRINTLFKHCKNGCNSVSEMLSTSSSFPGFNNMAGSKHDLIFENTHREMFCLFSLVLSSLNTTQSLHSETDKRWWVARRVFKWNVSHFRKHEPLPARYAWALDFNLIVNDASSSQQSRSGTFLLKHNVRLNGWWGEKNSQIVFIHQFYQHICQSLLQLLGCINTKSTEANQIRFIWTGRHRIYFCHLYLQALMSNAKPGKINFVSQYSKK